MRRGANETWSIRTTKDGALAQILVCSQEGQQRLPARPVNVRFVFKGHEAESAEVNNLLFNFRGLYHRLFGSTHMSPFPHPD